MREELLKWIESCKLQLNTAFKEDSEAAMLIDALVNQYEICAMHLFHKRPLQRRIYIAKAHLGLFLKKIKANQCKKTSFHFDYSADNTNIDILFWPFQKMHVEMIKPVYQEGLKDNLQLRIFSQNPIIFDALEEFIGCVRLRPSGQLMSYLDSKTCLNIQAFSKRFRPFNWKNRKLTFHQVFTLSLLNAYDWIAHTILYFEALVKQFQPKAIFVGNDITYVGSVVCHLSQKNQIPTFTIMHGSIKSPFWKFSKANYFFLFGKKDLDLMKNRGIKASKLLVSGSPKLEEKLIRFEEVNKKSTADQIILIAFSGPGHTISINHHQKILQLLLNIIPNFPNERFVFKLHKKDKLHYYEKLNKCTNVSIIAYGDKQYSMDIYAWLAKAKVLITGASSAALDAMLVKVPVITIDLLGEISKVDFIAKGITFNVSDLENCTSQLKTILLQQGELDQYYKTANEFIETAFFQPEEGSSRFVLNAIKQKINLTLMH